MPCHFDLLDAGHLYPSPADYDYDDPRPREKHQLPLWPIDFQFLLCGYRSRVIERVLVDGEDWEGVASDCSLGEMGKCRNQSILLKGCHNHRRNRPIGHCELGKNEQSVKAMREMRAKYAPSTNNTLSDLRARQKAQGGE